MATEAQILQDEKQHFINLSLGDKVAFTKIFDHYEPRMFPFVLKITRSENIAEEIIQEIFIKLWTDRHIAASIINPRSYIFKMATNRTANYLRDIARKSRLMSHAASRLETEKNTTEETIDAKELQEIINRAVEQLPEQQRKVYLLNRQMGFKNEEIAEQLNISPNTVKNHLTHALRFIKEKLQQYPGSAIAIIIFLTQHNRN